jgi:hypothetical protein
LHKQQHTKYFDDFAIDKGFQCFDEFFNSKSTFFPKNHIRNKCVDSFLSEIQEKFSYINEYFSNNKSFKNDDKLSRIYMYINQEIFERIEIYLKHYRSNMLNLKFEKDNLYKSFRSEMSILKSSIVENQANFNSIKEQERVELNTNFNKVLDQHKSLNSQLKKFLKTDFKKVLKLGNWGFDMLFLIQNKSNTLNQSIKKKLTKFTQIYKKWKQIYSTSKTKLIYLESITSKSAE